MKSLGVKVYVAPVSLRSSFSSFCELVVVTLDLVFSRILCVRSKESSSCV